MWEQTLLLQGRLREFNLAAQPTKSQIFAEAIAGEKLSASRGGVYPRGTRCG